MTSKIRIKMGEIEVEYEGSEDFLKTELPQLLTAVSELYSEAKGAPFEESEGPATFNTGPLLQGTTSSIAAKLKCDSGPDLAVAAAVRLVYGLQKESFNRSELLTEMKSARSYYNKNMSSNLSNILDKLVKAGKFNELSKDTYTLTQAERSKVEAQLGNA